MSVIDVDHWADALIHRYAGQDVIGSAVFVITLADIGASGASPTMIPLDGHPVPFLLGFVPPPTCLALGLVSAGWAAPIDSPVRPSAHPEAKRVVQAVVLARDGALGGRFRMPDGSIVPTGAGGTGRVVDALRVALDLPLAA